MRGLIGENVSHSFSKMIHERLINQPYSLYSLSFEKVHQYFEKKAFSCINVTIPYKQVVLPYLKKLTPIAQALQAVNCVKLTEEGYLGHNSDVSGFAWLLKYHQIDLKNKVVAILGSGGACAAVKYAVYQQSPKKVYIVSRNPQQDAISYHQLYQQEVDVVINTTPVGMMPNMNHAPIDITAIKEVRIVIDLIYNPLRTQLMCDAMDHHIQAYNGLAMLVAQARDAIAFFDDVLISDDCVIECIHFIEKQLCNYVFIGMPASGKTTLAKVFAQAKGYPFYDVDQLIEESVCMSVADYFKIHQEEAFRKKETEIIHSLAHLQKSVIACGGGVVLKKENMDILRKNSILIGLHRDISNIMYDNSRPLLKKQSDYLALYEKRKSLYEHYQDILVYNNESIPIVLEKLLRRITQ